MPTTIELAQATTQLINWCTAHILQIHVDPLPRHWFERMRGQPHPLWIDIAHHLFSHCEKDAVRTVLQHAVALQQQAAGIATAGSSKPAFCNHYEGLDQAFSPQHVLLLAAHAHGWANPRQTLAPTDLANRLLWHRLRQPDGSASHHSPQVYETLNLVQMLVFEYRHHIGYEGLLLRLELQAVDSTPHSDDDPQTPAAGRLIPAPGASLLWLDSALKNGIDRVQSLLNSVLKPGAPAIAWGFASLAQVGDAVQSVSVLGGASATAALAYGALYLLRDHLDTSQLHVQTLAQYLCALEEPDAVSITADLDAYNGTDWPQLRGVDGVPEKLAALDTRLPPGCAVRFSFVAQEQEEDPRIAHAQRACDLGQLIEGVERLTSSLNPDARQLHQALLSQASDADIAAHPAHQATMARLNASPPPGQGVRAHLVWRYAQLCGGAPTPFGNVAQLGQHFVNLIVEGPPGHTAVKNRANLRCSRLQDILYPSDPDHVERWRTVPAWVILAPPFSGKTTLINHWELSRIRAALREKAQNKRWGEVPVFLPMKHFMRHNSSATTSSLLSAAGLGQALRQYAQEVAPALPWNELLPDNPPTPQQLSTPRRDGLRVRLCIDALNEYRTGQADEGSAISLLCDWLAPRCAPHLGGALLPPVFSVRREEAGNFQLNSHTQPGWQAHHITVQAWSPSQMRAYIVQRQLPAPVQTKLLQALQLPLQADDDSLRAADAQGPANKLASFYQTPGFLSAQCTLLAHWPELQPSERRAHVMLALAWYCLDTWCHSAAHHELKQQAQQDPALAALLHWLLPLTAQNQLRYITRSHRLVLEWEPNLAGGLIEGLARVADAMQDPQGGTPEESAPWHPGPQHPGLCSALTTEWPHVFPAQSAAHCTDHWLAQAVASGLVLQTLRQPRPNARAQPWLAYTHQQLQELFSALSVTPLRLPDLTPPALNPPTQNLNNHLRQAGSKLELPAVTPHTERLRFAADLATPEGALSLIEAVLQQGNLALAAQLAIDQRARLEPPMDGSGRVVSHGFWWPERRHPLLQHLRARLLLASVDTGVATRPKLHASGLLAGIADAVQTLPEPWRSQWAPLLPALRHPAELPPAQDLAPGWLAHLTTGIDLRQRLHYGLLLGELGDNIRYERVSAEVPVDADPTQTQTRVGIRLKAAHWAYIPGSVPGVVHRIGSDRKADQGRDNYPAWTVPDGDLPDTLFAHTPALVMQWQAFWEDPLAKDKPHLNLLAMIDSQRNNPLLPITTLNWFHAQAFTAWASPLHRTLSAGLGANARTVVLGLPTEVQHEAAIRFTPAHSRPCQQAWWPHNASDHSKPGNWWEPGELAPSLFNHDRTRWGAPAPVGVFSAALTPSGIEAMGNVWTWCSNQQTESYQDGPAQQTASQALVKADLRVIKNPRLTLRGGSFRYPACYALAAYRFCGQPDEDHYNFGLRWQLSRPVP